MAKFRKILNVYQTEVVCKLDEFVNQIDARLYPEDGFLEILTIIEEGKNAVSKATTNEEVDDVYNQVIEQAKAVKIFVICS